VPTSPPSNTQAAALLTRLDQLPLTKEHRRVRRLGGLGYLFDTFDGTLMGYAMAAVIALWAIEESTAGWLLSAIFFGYLIGSLASGVLADRFGRRRLMMAALLIFTVFSVLMATSQSPTELFIWRMLSGIGLGAESVLVVPYLSELVPARYRASFLGRTVAFFGYGGVLAGIVALLVIGPNAHTWWGWRIAGVIAVVPIVLLLIMRRSLPESPRFLISQGRMTEAEQIVERFERSAGVDSAQAAAQATAQAEAQALPDASPVAASRLSLGAQLRAVFAPGLRRRTLVIWLLWFSLTGVNYGFASWMVNMLIIAKGFTVSNSFLFAFTASGAQIPGYLLAAWLVNKFEKKWVIASFAAAAALSAIGVAMAEDVVVLLIASALLAAFINGSAAAYYGYTAELYPTAIRTTGVGFASAAGRVGAILAPITIGYVFAAAGFATVFLGLTALLLFAVTITVIFGERTNGLSLENIESLAQTEGTAV